jgi:hypothetical protein
MGLTSMSRVRKRRRGLGEKVRPDPLVLEHKNLALQEIVRVGWAPLLAQ